MEIKRVGKGETGTTQPTSIDFLPFLLKKNQ